MRLSIIVAMAENRVIGRGGTLPWRLSADLKRFKSLTMGHHLVMGRKTFESIGRVLPGRTSVVVSRQETGDRRQGTDDVGSACSLSPVPCPLRYAHSFDAAIASAAGDPEVFVIGGAQIYEIALPRADRLYVTHVEAEVEGDTFFAAYDPDDWQRVEETHHAADATNEFPHRFCIYDRVTR